MPKLQKLQFVQPSTRSWSQWLKVTRSELCCDCGLVHRVQYALETDRRGKKVLRKRVRVDKGKTAQWRKQKAFQKV